MFCQLTNGRVRGLTPALSLVPRTRAPRHPGLQVPLAACPGSAPPRRQRPLLRPRRRPAALAARPARPHQSARRVRGPPAARRSGRVRSRQEVGGVPSARPVLHLRAGLGPRARGHAENSRRRHPEGERHPRGELEQRAERRVCPVGQGPPRPAARKRPGVFQKHGCRRSVAWEYCSLF